MTGGTTRAPTEFRYFARLGRPGVRRLRSVSRALFGFDPAPPDEVARSFASMYYDADPLAEAFVEEVYFGARHHRGPRDAGAGARRRRRRCPTRRRRCAASSTTSSEDPPWVDRELVEHGARVFRR